MRESIPGEEVIGEGLTNPVRVSASIVSVVCDGMMPT
jgi:hypothetical protein